MQVLKERRKKTTVGRMNERSATCLMKSVIGQTKKNDTKREEKYKLSLANKFFVF